MKLEKDVILRYVEAEEAAATPRLEAWIAQEWASAMELARAFGIPPTALQRLRECGAGPPWRPKGHQILYPVVEFRDWAQTVNNHPAALFAAAEPIDSVIRKFIERSAPHDPGGFERWATIKADFWAFYIEKAGLRPPDRWEKILRQEILKVASDVASGDRMFSYWSRCASHRDADGRKRYRSAICGWGRYRFDPDWELLQFGEVISAPDTEQVCSSIVQSPSRR